MESKPKPKPSARKRSSGKSPSPARRIGYIFAILFMILFIWVLRHLREWGVTFLTEDFDRALIYIELSIYASIIAQAIFVFYDNRWFKHLAQGITSVFAALSIIMIYVIFPFNIADDTWIKWIKIGVLILFIITVITIPVELFKGFRDLTKDPEKV